MTVRFDLVAATQLLVVGGSRAYGLHTPDSDVDVKGLCAPPRRLLYGFLERFEQADDPAWIAAFTGRLTDDEQRIVARSKLEGSVYALAKFMRLGAEANPHILDVLFGRDDAVRVITPVGQALRDGRRRFLSQRARDSFGGYASAQLKRIRTHRRWLLSPPERPPERADFGLPPATLIPADQLGAARAAVEAQLARWDADLEPLAAPDAARLRAQIADALTEQLAHDRFTLAGRAVGLDDNFIDLMDRERRYGAAHGEYTRYRGWLASRNPARAALEAAHGYDTKHAAHLVRLLRMALEITQTGEVHVWRGGIDADELQAIRAGAWSYDALEAWTDAATAALAAEAPNTPLPRRPDLAALDAWCVTLTEQALAAE